MLSIFLLAALAVTVAFGLFEGFGDDMAESLPEDTEDTDQQLLLTGPDMFAFLADRATLADAEPDLAGEVAPDAWLEPIPEDLAAIPDLESGDPQPLGADETPDILDLASIDQIDPDVVTEIDADDDALVCFFDHGLAAPELELSDNGDGTQLLTADGSIVAILKSAGLRLSQISVAEMPT